MNSTLTEAIEGRSINEVEEHIYSAINNGAQLHHYDNRASIYDLIVGTNIYHRVMWGTAFNDYVKFADDALRSAGSQIVMDAGCGSMLFTAALYLRSDKTIIAFDQSLSMLQRAKARLMKPAGDFPKNVVLVQADITDLPFKHSYFNTVLSLNVLHMFNDNDRFFSNLSRLLSDQGRLFFTSLIVNERAFGNIYLRMLYRSQEIGKPRTLAEIEGSCEKFIAGPLAITVRGNMAFIHN